MSHVPCWEGSLHFQDESRHYILYLLVLALWAAAFYRPVVRVHSNSRWPFLWSSSSLLNGIRTLKKMHLHPSHPTGLKFSCLWLEGPTYVGNTVSARSCLRVSPTVTCYISHPAPSSHDHMQVSVSRTETLRKDLWSEGLASQCEPSQWSQPGSQEACECSGLRPEGGQDLFSQ